MKMSANMQGSQFFQVRMSLLYLKSSQIIWEFGFEHKCLQTEFGYYNVLNALTDFHTQIHPSPKHIIGNPHKLHDRSYF